MEMPARGDAALSAAIRFASAPTTCCCAAVGGSAALRMRHTPCGCRSAHLVEVQTNLLLPTMHTVSIMRTAASEAMPLRQAIPGLIESEVERSYVRVMNRRQSDSEDRSKSNRLDIKQGRHLIRQALQFFELLACNGGGKGQGPLRSLGGPRGIFSHVREYPPFFAPRTVRGTPLPFRAKRKNRTYLAVGSIFRSYSPSSTARRSLTLPSSASSIVWISASRSRLSVPPRGR